MKYQQFVKRNIGQFHGTPQQRMSQVAYLWKQHGGGVRAGGVIAGTKLPYSVPDWSGKSQYVHYLNPQIVPFGHKY